MNISTLIRESHRTASDHGWWEGEQNFAEKLALVHSEISETLEEFRNGHNLDEIYFDESKSHEKPEGVPVELADALIRIFDMAGYWGINLEAALRLKMAYNKKRPYRHGGKKC